MVAIVGVTDALLWICVVAELTKIVAGITVGVAIDDMCFSTVGDRTETVKGTSVAVTAWLFMILVVGVLAVILI